MRNSIITVMKKEFMRFFTDRRMVVTTLLMPGIMIYFLYSFMGSVLGSKLGESEDFVASIAVQNLPESMQTIGAQRLRQ